MTPNRDRANLRPPVWADVDYPDRATRAARRSGPPKLEEGEREIWRTDSGRWQVAAINDGPDRATRAARHRVRARRAEKRRDNLVITLACIAILLALWAILLAADARTLALVGIHQAGA